MTYYTWRDIQGIATIIQQGFWWLKMFYYLLVSLQKKNLFFILPSRQNSSCCSNHNRALPILSLLPHPQRLPHVIASVNQPLDQQPWQNSGWSPLRGRRRASRPGTSWWWPPHAPTTCLLTTSSTSPIWRSDMSLVSPPHRVNLQVVAAVNIFPCFVSNRSEH